MTIDRKLRKLLLLVLLTVPITAQQSFSSDLEQLTLASNRANKIIMDALKKSDAGKLVSVLTDDGALISPTGHSIQGSFTIRAMASVFLSTVGSGEVSATRQSLTLIDGRGYEAGRFETTEKLDNGKTRTISGRYTLVWKFEDKEWKIDVAIAIR